jgi:transposase
MPEFKPELVPNDKGTQKTCPECGFTKPLDNEPCQTCQNIALAKSGVRSGKRVQTLIINLDKSPRST